MTRDGRISRLLVPELDDAPDEDLAVAHDGPDRSLAFEDRFQRVAVCDERQEVLALRGRARGEKLREADRDVLWGWVREVSF